MFRTAFVTRIVLAVSAAAFSIALGSPASFASPAGNHTAGVATLTTAVRQATVMQGRGNARLNAVACPATTDCFAVGLQSVDPYREKAVAEHWNGFAWSVEHVPQPSTGIGAGTELDAISCASRNQCMAVGKNWTTTDSYRVLAERWNGRRWSITKTPGGRDDALNGVSCTSLVSCIAVGMRANQYSMVEHWNGSRWRAMPSPNPTRPKPWWRAELESVSCWSANDCMATGYSEGGVTDQQRIYRSWDTMATLAERWTGKRWLILRTRNPNLGHSFENRLVAVSCMSRTTCIAVGEVYRSDGSSQHLLNGGTERHGTEYIALSPMGGSII